MNHFYIFVICDILMYLYNCLVQVQCHLRLTKLFSPEFQSTLPLCQKQESLNGIFMGALKLQVLENASMEN